MKRCYLSAWFLALAFLMLSACANSDSDQGGLVGVAVDPYIVGAMFQEILADGTLGQTSTYSAEDGTFVFDSPLAPDSTVRMIVSGTHNGIPFDGNFKTDLRLAGSSLVLSPLTTLLANLMEAGLSSTEANGTVVGFFADAGLALSEDELLSDPLGAFSKGFNFDILQATMATNAFFLSLEMAGMDGYRLKDPSGYLAHMDKHQDLLANMVAALRSSLRKEGLDQIQAQVEADLGGGQPDGFAVSDRDLIYACTAKMDFIAEKVAADLREDGVLDLNPEELVTEETLAELALHNFVARHANDPAFVEAYAAAGIPLPEVEAGATFSLDASGVVQVASTPDNRPPVADAGEDQLVETGMVVTLDGSGSDDADGELLNYRWAFVSVPEGSAIDESALSDPSVVSPTFVPDLPGTYELALMVSDGELDSRSSLVDIDAFSTNTPPVADAGTDQTVRRGIFSFSEAYLDGSGSSDADADPLSYHWTFVAVPPGSTLDPAALSDAAAISPTFTPDVEGEYLLQLVVSDGEVDSVPDLVTVTAPGCGGHSLCGF